MQNEALWTAVIAAFVEAQGAPADDDDQRMCDATACALVGWCEDLRDRVGVDVDDMLDAVYAYVDARDTATACALLQEAAPDAVVVPHDPRGSAIAGAEINPVCGDNVIGLYVDVNGVWYVQTWAPDVDDVPPAIVSDADGKADRAQVIGALRVAIAATRGGTFPYRA